MATYIKNKKASLKYEILEKFEAGIKLLGFEAKSIKNNKGSLDGSHISIRGGEAIIFNLDIPPYQPNNTPESYDPKKNRTLLLNKKEIEALMQKEDQKGLTIIPLSMYNKGNKIKVEIAIVRGKKKYDHREDIKKKDMKRDSDREMKEKLK
ncbi:MAG: SsrA-binding protein SmpB [Candidatus Pacebacteria bacterium]|nr:SsrA-binding protein SmpB [Candidatus Paceibacterota bacterium]